MNPNTSPSRAKSKDTVAPLTVKVGGTALDPTLANKVVEVIVKKVRVLPDMAYVRLADIGQKLVDSPPGKLEDDLEILTGAPNAATAKTLFKGVITAMEPEFRDDGVFVAFRAFDKAHAMTRAKHTRVFQDKTIGDIVSDVCRSYFSVSVEGDTGGPQEYMMQSNESDWDFAWRLAGLIGFELATEGPTAKFRKVGTADGEGPWLQYGQSEAGHRLYSFRPRISNANLPESITAKYIDVMGKEVTAAVTLASGKISTVDKAPASVNTAFGKVNGKGTFAMPDVVAKSQTELKAVLESQRDQFLASAVEAEGIAEGHPDLKPGVKIELKGLGKYSGKYLLSETVHVYRGATGFRTRFHTAARPKSLLEAVAPQSTKPKPSPQNGVVQGEVTNINDPEKIGRLRVKFPTMAQDSDPEGWWARVSTISAGQDRGIMMLPQVGDKVVVGFENGDTRKPVILGSVFDGGAKPGEALINDKGSFSVMSDSKVLMKSKDNFEFVTEKAWTAKAEKAVTFENSMEAFTIKSGKEIVLKAPTIKLEATMGIEMKGSQVKINGDATLEIKAPSITVGGGMVKLGQLG